MYILYTDKQEVFECSISLEGASVKNSQARLIVESDNLNLLFKGTIDSNGKCTVPIKKLKNLLEESTKGKIRLEVIADDTYFTPWESNFEVETARKVTVEVKSQSNQNIISESKPSISCKKY
jgi:TusA-related sulfurtransferase